MPTVVAKVPVFVRVKDTLIRIILARCSKKTGQMQHLVWAGGRPRDPRKRNRMNLMSPGSAARPAVTVGRKGYFRSFVAEEIRPTNVPFRTSQDSRA